MSSPRIYGIAPPRSAPAGTPPPRRAAVLALILVPFAFAPPLAALGKVLQQLAGDRGGFPCHPHPRSAQHLLALRGMGDGGSQQRHRQPPVLFARRVDEPPRVNR